MVRFRSRCSAAVLALALALSPLAAAAPAVPVADSWWSTLAAGVDGLLGLFGIGGTDTVTANAQEGPGLEPDGASLEEGPGLEPDGASVQPTDRSGGPTARR